MKQPNILVIMSDQHHKGMMGCAGHPVVKTPHIDSLAARGTRFEYAYCNSPLCCPSRMSFLTSRLPSSLNILDNAGVLEPGTRTFAHAFNEAGYETVLSGRMHINGPDQLQGFSQRLIGDVLPDDEPQGEAIRKVLGEYADCTGPQAVSIRKSGAGRTGYQAFDERVAEATADWLHKRKDGRPFMLTVGFILPHAPFVGPEEDVARYDPLVGLDDLPKPGPLHPELQRLQRRAGLDSPDAVSGEDQRRARVAYYAMCTHLDRQVGQVLEALEESGQRENTIVVYTSDHGEQLGEHGMWWKHTFYEGSVGVPMLFAGPGIPTGQVISSNVSLMDLAPTLLSLAEAAEMPGAEGASFAKLLRDSDASWNDRVIAENLWPPDADCIHRMLVKGPWKLNTYEGYEPELFHRSSDPQERVNRANDPECAGILADLLDELAAGWNHGEVLERHRVKGK